MKKALFILLFPVLMMQSGMGQNVSFSGHFIYQSPSSRIFSVTAADLDNDNNPDILFAEPDRDLLQWFKNENNGQFALNAVGNFPAIGAIAVDIDSDQDMDVLACSYDLNQVVLFENDGSQTFTMHVISASVQHPLMLAAGDIDKDGDPDIVCATQDAGTGMVLLRNDGNLSFTYTQLSTQSISSTWAAIADLDKDSDLDIIGNSFMASGGLLWYEQTSPMAFTEHLIPFPWAHGGAIGDIDGDGDLDLAGASCGSSVAWFENDGSNVFAKHTLTGSLNCPVSVEISDIDNDGHNDLVSEAWGSSRISLWLNDGNQVFANKVICDTLISPNGLCVADLNHDSLPDIIACSYSHKLDWFENEGSSTRITDPDKRLAVKVLRDPVNGDIVIDFGKNEPGRYEVQLINMIGRIYFSALSETNGFIIRANQLQDGICLLRVVSADRQFVVKIVQDQKI
jgi:hypothetical protein